MGVDPDQMLQNVASALFATWPAILHTFTSGEMDLFKSIR